MSRHDLSEDALAALAARCGAVRGLDFSGFKSTTLTRRVRSRMARLAIDDVDAYVARVAADDAEAERLAEELLVTITALFREPETFALLRSGPLAALAGERAAAGATLLRAWVPACASGEEALSLAMCLVEATEAVGGTLEAAVLATDVSRRALEAARAGRVRVDGDDVPPDLARRFLRVTATGFAPTPELSQRVRFAEHDVLCGSPPVPREAVVASFDVVSCRNLLIYLTPVAQERLVTRLIKATAPDALLVLGRSERPPPSLAEELVAIDPNVPVYRVRRAS